MNESDINNNSELDLDGFLYKNKEDDNAIKEVERLNLIIKKKEELISDLLSMNEALFNQDPARDKLNADKNICRDHEQYLMGHNSKLITKPINSEISITDLSISSEELLDKLEEKDFLIAKLERKIQTIKRGNNNYGKVCHLNNVSKKQISVLRKIILLKQND